MIEEVDFNNLKNYKDKEFSPVLFVYNKEAFSLALKNNQIDNSWELFFKIFLNRFNNDFENIIEDNFIDKLLFKTENNNGCILLSHSDDNLNNRTQKNKHKVVKFANNSYIKIFNNNLNNLLLIKKIIKSNDFKGLKLFVSLNGDIDTPEFNKDYKKLERKYKKYNIKKAVFVASHINGKILNDFEKLVKYVRDEFKTRKLIGDIKLNENQETLLNQYMKRQLIIFDSNPSDFSPEYPRLFALALVRYAMRNYNKRHLGEFWPYFNTEYGIKIDANSQKYIHDIFESVLKNDHISYLEDGSNKIDNITMHTFVSDNSASQLFDYLFDFWRLDLLRNVENFNNNLDGIDVFGELIKVMKIGNQNIRSHTSQLLKFPKLTPIFKNRIRRIFRLINDSFWNDKKVNETGNRINALLNKWIEDPKGAFQKEKQYIAKHTSKEKGEILYHSPILKLNSNDEKLNIILPVQRLVDCCDLDKPIWTIEYENNGLQTFQVEPDYKKDKIGYYIDKTSIEIPLESMLSDFKFSLNSLNKLLKKYEIKSSKIRFFDSNGKYIDHNTSLLPQGFVSCYSDSKDYPQVLGEYNTNLSSKNLYLKNFNLTKGQIVVLDDNTGIQVAQKLNEGYTESYPLNGLIIKDSSNSYEVYSKLPKLLFKADPKELDGISLTINQKNYKVSDFNIKEFKIANELNVAGYLIDLNDYIKSDGLYEIFLSYPKYKKQLNHSLFAYIRGFKYSFKDSPYVFKEEATIDIPRRFNFIELNDNKWADSIKYDFDMLNFTFNFAERDSNQTDKYCELVNIKDLVLTYKLNNELIKFYFYIPALYWKFNLNDEWEVRKPQDILLKDLKNQKKKLYISGPFNFNKMSITTDDDIDIAEEESEIKCIETKDSNSKKLGTFDLSKSYDWFSNNRDEIFRTLYINLDENNNRILTNVICRSILKNINLIADFDNNILYGDVDIYGNESYTISIKYQDEIICEDKQIINGKFEAECENKLKSGNYEINVYEVVEGDSDGFDVETTSLILNKESIIKKVINLSNLDNVIILLKGYQDKENKYFATNFSRDYYISDLENTTFLGLIDDETITEEDGEIDNLYGVWNQEINYLDKNIMNSFVWYKGNLKIDKYNGTPIKLSEVLIMFTNKVDMKSMCILIPDADGDYSSLVIDTENELIVTGYQYAKLTRKQRRQTEMFDDNYDYFLIDFKEDKKYGI